MRRRAELWSGRRSKPVPYQTPKAFVYTLVHAGMCMLETDDQLPGTPDDQPAA
jgi:hypothetical protein